jgi:hypothetical protein
MRFKPLLPALCLPFFVLQQLVKPHPRIHISSFRSAGILFTLSFEGLSLSSTYRDTTFRLLPGICDMVSVFCIATIVATSGIATPNQDGKKEGTLRHFS